jgi:hypothetical protein
MKSRLFKVIIAAEFEQEFDEDEMSSRIMQALQTAAIPRGRAQVLAEAIPAQVVRLPREVLDRLN